jgi:archaellum component FlaC
METLYFTLGIASVVVTAFAVGTIWVMFKVAKINSRLRECEDQFGSTHREIEMVEQTIMNNIRENLNELDNRFNEVYASTDRIATEIHQTTDELNKELALRTDELNRYIDSRVDKLAAKAEING